MFVLSEITFFIIFKLKFSIFDLDLLNMKILFKRRNLLVLFIVFIIVSIFYMTYNLNQIVNDELGFGNVKVYRLV
jgi:hypothetical protein